MLHFEPGAAPADYTWIGNFAATSATADLIAPYLNRQVVTIRWGRAFPATGIRITLDERTNVRTSPTVTYSVTIESPALGIAQQTFTGDDWRLEIDDVEETAVECDAFSWQGSALRLSVDGVVVLSLGAQAHSGFGYDTRENKTRNHAQSGPDPIGPFPLIGCDSDNRFPTQSEIGSCTAKLQVYYDTGGGDTAFDLSIDSAMACPATVPPAACAACACSMAPPTISGVTSADQECSAFARLSRAYVSGGLTSCTCPDGFVIHPEIHYSDLDFYLGDSYVDIEDESSTLLHETRRYRRAACSCEPINDPADYTISDAYTTEAVTYCQSHQDVQRITAIVYCMVEDGDPCLLHHGPPGDPVSPAPCPFPDSDPCYYHCTLNLMWPSDLCGGSCCGSLDVSKSGRWYHAFIKTATNAVVTGNASSSFLADRTPVAWQDFDAGFVADSVCIRYDKLTDSPRLWIVYDDGGTIYRRSSNNHGETWSMPSTIAAGENPTHDPIEAGRRYVYWGVGTAVHGVVYDHEWNTVIAAFTATGIAIDSGTEMEVKVHSGGAGQMVIVLTYTEGGNVKTAYSFDAQAFT